MGISLSNMSGLRPEGSLAPGSWIASLDDVEPWPSLMSPVPHQAGALFTPAAAGCEKSLRLLHGSDPSGPSFATRGPCTAVFDGVLYNREILREELGDAQGSSPSDADVILEAYFRLGERVLHRIKGIFALIIWDRAAGKLVAARDPLGIYPLFYAQAGGELLFSTSIEALIRHPHVSRELNRAVLAEHLCRRWLKPDETYYAAVRRVPPGHALRIDRDDHRPYRYWNGIPSNGSVEWIDHDQLEQFDEMLDQAVNRCLELGPSGIFLSGGLDSVSVAAVAVDRAHCRGYAVPWALSLGFPHPECNEEAIQKGVAEGLGIPQKLIPFGEAVGPPGLLSSALEMSAGWPAPLLNPWRPAYYQLGLAGKAQGCRVILTGNGGDDWLTVNPAYTADLIRGFNLSGLYWFLSTMLRSYRLRRLAMLRTLLWKYGVRLLLVSFVEKVGRRAAPGLLRAYRRRRIKESMPAWVAPDPSSRQMIDRRSEYTVERLMQEPEPGGPHGFYFRDFMNGVASHFSSLDMEEHFELGQRMGMQIVHPYWDADLIELLCRIPPEQLDRGGREKGLVRQMLGRRFPHLGFERQRKVSASGFFQSILQAEGPAMWKRMGGPTALVDLGVIDGRAVDSIMARSLSSTEFADTHRIWEMLSLEAWVRPRV
jgi:asparagine synthase (glutamine-hydrolysing)